MAEHAPFVVAHVGDAHFGRRATRVTRNGDNVRELDIYRAGDVVSAYIANTVKPDLIVNTGDTWDSPLPGTRALHHGISFHTTIREAGIPVVVIGGNHDTLSTPGRPSPIEHLAKHFDCRVVLEQEDFEIDGIRLCGIPYRSVSSGDLRDPDFSADSPNLMLVHSTVDGEDMPDFSQYDYTRLPKHLLAHDRVTLSLLGHIHIHQHVGHNAYYCGAFERLTWGEIVNEPAIYVHRIWPNGRTETESIPVSAMGVEGVPRPARILNIDCSQIEAGNVLEAGIALLDSEPIDGALVRLHLRDAPADLHTIHFEEPLHKRAATRGAFALDVKTHLRGDDLELLAERENLTAVDHAPGAALSDAFKTFAEHNGDPDLAELGCQLIAAASGEIQDGES